MKKEACTLTLILVLLPLIAVATVRASSEGWTLIRDGKGVKAYPNLRGYYWEKVPDALPNEDYDKIGLHRVVEADSKPLGVVLILSGVFGNGESQMSNPPEAEWTILEENNLAYYLANRGFDVYAMDYRTHFVPKSLSNPDDLEFMKNWGWEQWISDIKEAVDLAKTVSGTQKIYLMGQSFGGRAIMNYASLYWKQDLEGIILMDGRPEAKSEEVTNTYNLTAAMGEMVAAESWAEELGSPGAIFVMEHALENPEAPAEFPPGNPLPPPINPLTNQSFANMSEWVTFMLYAGDPAGVQSNIPEGMSDLNIILRMITGMDRYWPHKLRLEANAVEDWDNCPYDVMYDFDDHYSEIDVRLLNVASELYGIPYWGPLRNGIANSDYTELMLPRYGHMDVWFGMNAENDVYVPTYEWLMVKAGTFTLPTTEIAIIVGVIVLIVIVAFLGLRKRE